MVAIIRIENQIDTELSENENERILLSKIMGEEVFGFNGVINWTEVS